MLLYISFFIVISLFVYSMLTFKTEKTARRRKRIDAYFTNMSITEENEEDPSFSERVLTPLWRSIKLKYQRKWNKEKASKLEIKLLQAGQPFGLSPVEFKIVQRILLFFFPLIGWGYALLLNSDLSLRILLSLLGIAAALVLPKYYLKTKAAKRSKLAVKELPDTLDLLTISLEGGLGFDSALSKVVSKKKGVLSEEFKRCLEEIRLGKTRKEALNAINDRLYSEELQSLVYNIVQAEKLGVGMVKVLRVQTEDIREQRRQRAEEAAMKAPIKMMFPLVLFIFPTLFIILLGPAILQFMDAF
ncbi:type II secretion system protein [Halobacillus andaensis]|uniref:Type II secretion system protein n=1 Tax=Halobacillus andaensis TaxID=1176239 RepID=A0A917EWY6_HALAA|nr:type II secretion system F family protein [Halobacillus andaensis]MBP2005084.1 tight adherence protein C [Halobacillus andaensis]GGF28773.1 type II secretion system protein [Halobacillus andaensis]